jgi:DNA-binding winged helix-turn-helix (wHTH) protein
LPRYRFADFTLSPRRRTLVRGGRELPLIPRYFDLLVFLVEHRHEAVPRRHIFEHVWSEVIVCDSALSQAVRTLRRTLEDDSREPRFIRTVARHGYQFIYPDVVVDEESGAAAAIDATAAAEPHEAPDSNANVDRFEPLLQRLIAIPTSEVEEEEQREAAELLHAHGTAEALRRLGTRAGHVRARALLRDARWDVPGAGDVPIVGQPNAPAVAVAVVAVRLRRAARAAAARWLAAAIGAGLAGAAAGVLGGVALSLAPGSTAPLHVSGVLGVVGACVGALAGAGVGAGLTFGEATARSNRVAAVVANGALGGGCAGFVAQWLGRWTLDTLVGIRVDVGGGVEGLVIGALSGLGYALTTRRAEGGLAAPRGRRLVQVVAATGGACAAGGVALALIGRPLVGGTIHAIALASAGSHALLTPLGRLLGEPDFGPVTRTVIAAGETGLFGAGLALGLTRSPKSHDSLTSR